MASVRRVNRARLGYWIGVAVFVAALLVFRFWQPTAANHRHSYLLSNSPDPPGVLVSDRWSWNFVVDGLFVFLWLAPLTGALMTTYALSSGVRIAHMLTLALLLALFFVTLIYSGVAWYARANEGTADNALNPANDPRWCCLYANIVDEVVCSNKPKPPCAPPVGADKLVVDRLFLFRFWFNVGFVALMVVDFAYTLLVMRPAANQYISAVGPEGTGSYLGAPLIARRYKRRK